MLPQNFSSDVFPQSLSNFRIANFTTSLLLTQGTIYVQASFSRVTLYTLISKCLAKWVYVVKASMLAARISLAFGEVLYGGSVVVRVRFATKTKNKL